MPRSVRRRRSRLPLCTIASACLAAACASLAGTARPLRAQDPSTAPASVPAGIQSAPSPAATAATVPAKPVSEKQAREADDAYLAGARALERDDLLAAERDFGRAAQLDPAKPEYALSLAITREHRVSELVKQAANARHAGNTALADSLLAQAHALAPDNSIVAQHFAPPPAPMEVIAAANLPGSGSTPNLGGAIQLKPSPGLYSFHQSAPAEELLRSVYLAYGIRVQFPTALGAGRTFRLDLDDVDYDTAIRVIDKLVNCFAVPVQPDLALVVTNTQESRDQYQPLLEETVYLPGLSGDALSELANVARVVFEVKSASASQTGGNMLVRADANTLRLLNATYADMLDGGSDVQLDISLYEVDKTFLRNFGAQLPSSVGGFSIYSEVQSLITANQSTINAAVAAGLITLNGTPLQNLLAELGVLKAAGLLSGINQISGLLGYLGTYGGIPLVGVYLGSGTTFNLALTNSDVRTLDFAQLRSSNHQPASFRAGTRYPVITGTYSSGISASSLSGLGLTAAQQQAAQAYLGSAGTSVSIPQFQYEDLGLTVKATPSIQQDKQVTLQLEMKIEALGGTSLNNVPILNSRDLISTVTVATGETVLLASEVTRSEMRAINGLPGLSEIPGFEGTDKDTEKDTTEILITLTPHIIRVGHRESSSRRLAFGRAGTTP